MVCILTTAPPTIEQGGSVTCANRTGDTALHSEAMHCDPDAPWPSSAAQLMIDKVPGLASVTNAAGLTAEDLFDQDQEMVDAPETIQKEQVENVNRDATKRAAKFAKEHAAKKKKKGHTEEEMEKEPEQASLQTKIIVTSVIMLFFALVYTFLSTL